MPDHDWTARLRGLMPSADSLAAPLHTGRSTIVIQTDVHCGDGRHVTRTLQTQSVLT